MLHAFVICWVLSTALLGALLLTVVVVRRITSAIARPIAETAPSSQPLPDYAGAS